MPPKPTKTDRDTFTPKRLPTFPPHHHTTQQTPRHVFSYFLHPYCTLTRRSESLSRGGECKESSSPFLTFPSFPHRFLTSSFLFYLISTCFLFFYCIPSFVHACMRECAGLVGLGSSPPTTLACAPSPLSFVQSSIDRSPHRFRPLATCHPLEAFVARRCLSVVSGPVSVAVSLIRRALRSRRS